MTGLVRIRRRDGQPVGTLEFPHRGAVVQCERDGTAYVLPLEAGQLCNGGKFEIVPDEQKL